MVLAGMVLAGCGRFGYDFTDLVGPRAGDAGTSSVAGPPRGGAGGAAGAADATPGIAAGASGAGGAIGDAGAPTLPDPALSDAAAGSGEDSGEGSNIDAGSVPAGCAPDVPLRRRAENEPPVVVAGTYDSLDPGWSRLARNSEWFQLEGQGYIALRWQVEYANRAGQVNLPTVVSTGTFLRVGGGGGYHLDDPRPGTTGTYMGNAEQGISYMEPGADTPWHIEFYYLDGEVRITLNEGVGLHNIEFQSQPYSTLTTPGVGVYSPGVVCDRE